MKRPFIQQRCAVPPGHQRERGVTMVLVAVAMVAIISIAALSIDVITLYLAREEAQRSADASALAAARVISTSGMTGDPLNSSGAWAAVCGGPSSPASLAAIAVATHSPVGGALPSTPVVTYFAGGAAPVQNCSTLPAAFAVNPMVTVQITRTSLPTFFARIWGNTGNTVSAKATAEAFNPSASDINANVPNGNITPVRPLCVKPWMVPNRDPKHPGGCGGAIICNPFVTTADGSIQNPGVLPMTPTGVIGETFTLFADCGPGSACPRVTPQPDANVSGLGFIGGPAPPIPNLEYLPGLVTNASLAVPSCGTSGTGTNPDYGPAVAGCDAGTKYQCGVSSVSAIPPNAIDLTENPGGPTGDTASGLSCLLTNSSTIPLSGQDTLDATAYPYRIMAGSSNPVGVSGSVVTGSNSIMSLPIYDVSAPFTVLGNQANVTIVGFLQVFINQVNPNGSLDVTVMNVAGCGNGVTPANSPITGNSPVPVRLITPP